MIGFTKLDLLALTPKEAALTTDLRFISYANKKKAAIEFSK